MDLNAARWKSREETGNLYYSQAQWFLSWIIKLLKTTQHKPRYWRPTPELYSVGYCSDDQDTNHSEQVFGLWEETGEPGQHENSALKEEPAFKNHLEPQHTFN